MHVLICAETVVGEGFRYNSERLQALRRWASRGQVHVLVTEVACGEVEREILRGVRRASRAARRFAQEARILRNSSQQDLTTEVPDVDVSGITEELRQQWRQFLKDCHAEVVCVGVESASGQQVRYQAGRGVERDGEAEAVRAWAVAGGCRPMIVGPDEAWRDATLGSELLDYVPSLEGALQEVSVASGRLSDEGWNALRGAESEIEGMFVERFTGAAFYLADRDGQVDEVVVRSMDDPELVVLDISDRGVAFEVRGTINFEASVTYLDPRSAVWDERRGDYSFLEEVHERASLSVLASGTGVGRFDSPRHERLEDLDLDLDEQEFGVRLDDVTDLWGQ